MLGIQLSQSYPQWHTRCHSYIWSASNRHTCAARRPSNSSVALRQARVCSQHCHAEQTMDMRCVSLQTIMLFCMLDDTHLLFDESFTVDVQVVATYTKHGLTINTQLSHTHTAKPRKLRPANCNDAQWQTAPVCASFRIWCHVLIFPGCLLALVLLCRQQSAMTSSFGSGTQLQWSRQAICESCSLSAQLLKALKHARSNL